MFRMYFRMYSLNVPVVDQELMPLNQIYVETRHQNDVTREDLTSSPALAVAPSSLTIALLRRVGIVNVSSLIDTLIYTLINATRN